MRVIRHNRHAYGSTKEKSVRVFKVTVSEVDTEAYEKALSEVKIGADKVPFSEFVSSGNDALQNHAE